MKKGSSKKHMYEPIENYGVIGDLHTVALVSKKGAIDFMSFPRIDSPTIFAALLDSEKGGSFTITPQLKDANHKQLYIPETAVLLSRFFADEGIAEITDFMPVQRHEYLCTVIRRVTTVRGKITYRMQCAPRFDYATVKHTASREKDTVLFTAHNDAKTAVRLLSNLKLQIKEGDAFAEFTLEQGQSAVFILEALPADENLISSLEEFADESYKETIQYWKSWMSQSQYTGRWREVVNRSAITLKLLTSYTFGSPVASATFGLPEAPGGERNWDYRYTWIRDAAFTMYAFLRLGFFEEAEAFIAWIKEQSKKGDLQLMYTVDGSEIPAEQELSGMEGYRQSKPVRIGNGAKNQLQLDINGELIDTIYLYNKHGGPITFEFWKYIEKIVEFVIENWKRPDHGIWEIRHKAEEFLHSRMMCWVAMDRAIKIADDRSFPYPMTEWRSIRDEIFNDIFYNFWSEEKQAFVQHKGSDALDASVLLMPLMRILSPFEERWKSTLTAIEKELLVDVLVYRYHNNGSENDGFHSVEGTFSICSFWYVECLAKSGEVEKARIFFEKMLGYANHLGLFSEQIGPRGEFLGNFPQAFTHLALISAALELDQDIPRQKSSI